MNIKPISFKGASIGYNLKHKVEDQKQSPNGFYKVANFLNSQGNFDFEIRNAKGKYAEISTYIQSTKEEVGTLNVSIKDFEKNPSKVIKSLAKMIWVNNKVCQRIWLDRFKNSQQSDIELDDNISYFCDSKKPKIKIRIKSDN